MTDIMFLTATIILSGTSIWQALRGDFWGVIQTNALALLVIAAW